MIEEMNYLTTLDTQPKGMADEVKLRNLIETFADAFYHRMQYASEQEFNMGFTRRQAIVKYNNVEFELTEDYTTDVTTGKEMHRMCIGASRDLNVGICVMWECGHTMSKALDERKKGCYALAHRFVKEILPKIDFKLNTIMHNEEVEEILEVLE